MKAKGGLLDLKQNRSAGSRRSREFSRIVESAKSTSGYTHSDSQRGRRGLEIEIDIYEEGNGDGDGDRDGDKDGGEDGDRGGEGKGDWRGRWREGA